MPAPASLTDLDIASAARSLGCSSAAVRAVLTVETGGVGGFLKDGSGRPRILFEAQHFSEATGHRWDESHPTISSPTWDRALYLGGEAEYTRLDEAESLDRPAALASASWGLFQILGSNFRACGFADVESFVAAQYSSEAAQLAAFVAFAKGIRLNSPLGAQNWAEVARLYNGPEYAANSYDKRLAAAYRIVIGSVAQYLRIGTRGTDVAALQRALNKAGASLVVDGGFGRVTEIALQQFQAAHGLVADGVLGPATAAALGIG